MSSITQSVDGSIMIEGREAVELFRVMTIRRALMFEIKTGMKMTRVSALAAAQRTGLTNKRTKKGAAADLTAALRAAGVTLDDD